LDGAHQLARLKSLAIVKDKVSLIFLDRDTGGHNDN
jgi:hypothetical protein